MTRHHERRAAIVAAEVALAQPAAVQVQSDPDDTPSGAKNANDAMSLAIDAMNATDLGVSIIDELETLFRTIKALSAVGDVSQKAVQTQLATIQSLARLAVDYYPKAGRHECSPTNHVLAERKSYWRILPGRITL